MDNEVKKALTPNFTPVKVYHSWSSFDCVQNSNTCPAGDAAMAMCSLPNTHRAIVLDPVGIDRSDTTSTTSTTRKEVVVWVANFRKTVSGNAWSPDNTKYELCANDLTFSKYKPPIPRVNAVMFGITEHSFFMAGGVDKDGKPIYDAYIGTLHPATTRANGAFWSVKWVPVLGDPLDIHHAESDSTITAAPPDSIEADDVDVNGNVTKEYYKIFKLNEAIRATDTCPFIARGNDDIFLVKPLAFTDSRRRHTTWFCRLRIGAGGLDQTGLIHASQAVISTPAVDGWPVTESLAIRPQPLVPGFILGLTKPASLAFAENINPNDRSIAWIAQVKIPKNWNPFSDHAYNANGFSCVWRKLGSCAAESPSMRLGALVYSTGMRLNREATSAIVVVWGGSTFPGNKIGSNPNVYVGTFAVGTGDQKHPGYLSKPYFTWHTPSIPASESVSITGTSGIGACETLGVNSTIDKEGNRSIKILTFGGTTTASKSRTAILNVAVPARALKPGVGIDPYEGSCFTATPEAIELMRERELEHARSISGGGTDPTAKPTVEVNSTEVKCKDSSSTPYVISLIVTVALSVLIIIAVAIGAALYIRNEKISLSKLNATRAAFVA
jgi:hypothetical protein